MHRDRYASVVGWLGAAIVALVVMAGVGTAVNQSVSLAFLALGGVLAGVLVGLLLTPRTALILKIESGVAGIAIVAGVLLATRLVSFSEQSDFGEALVVIGAVVCGSILASVGLPPDSGEPPPASEPQGTGPCPTGDRGAPPNDVGGPDDEREQRDPVPPQEPPIPTPPDQEPTDQEPTVATGLDERMNAVFARITGTSWFVPLVLAGLALIVMAGLIFGIVELARTEARTTPVIVGSVVMLAPLVLLGGAIASPAGKRTPWFLSAVVTAFLGPLATTVIADVNDLVRKKPNLECLSAQAQAAEIVSFAEVGTLLKRDGAPSCVKGLRGLHEKQEPVQAIELAKRVPECVAVLAQLDELADDEPRLARQALQREGRTCQLLRGAKTGHGAENKLLAELAQR